MMGVMQKADLYLAILLRKRRFYKLIKSCNFEGQKFKTPLKKFVRINS